MAAGSAWRFGAGARCRPAPASPAAARCWWPRSMRRMPGLATRGAEGTSSAETAREIEFSRMGITCGFQDFYATTFGGLDLHGLSRQGDTGGARGWIRWQPWNRCLTGTTWSYPLCWLIPGRQRDSGETHRPLRARWVEGDSGHVRAAMRALGSIARQTKRAVLEHDWPAVGDGHEHGASTISPPLAVPVRWSTP